MTRVSLKAIFAIFVSLTVVACVSLAVRVHAQNASDQAETSRASAFITWRGVVDDKVEVAFQGSNVRTTIVHGKPVENQDYHVNQPMPSDNVTVALSRVEGRGTVKIVQQPDRDNGFTTIVRIHDRRGGSDLYKFSLTW